MVQKLATAATAATTATTATAAKAAKAATAATTATAALAGRAAMQRQSGLGSAKNAAAVAAAVAFAALETLTKYADPWMSKLIDYARMEAEESSKQAARASQRSIGNDEDDDRKGKTIRKRLETIQNSLNHPNMMQNGPKTVKKCFENIWGVITPRISQATRQPIAARQPY